MGRKKWQSRNQQPPVTHPVREFYVENEHLGSESRATEFKIGPGFINNGCRANVAKYLCAFLNSQENGKLLLGVDDYGYVIGYDCSHQEEDNIRRDVDEAVKDLTPPIFPQDHSIRFVPVCDEQGYNIGRKKVIEIIVYGGNIEVRDTMFCTKQGVFIRRDGSVQELKAAEIQEWMRRMKQSEIDILKNNEKNLQKELMQGAEKLEEKNKVIEKKENDLQRMKSENNQMADRLRQQQDEINQLRQQVEEQGAQGELAERMERMEARLIEQEAKTDHNSSKEELNDKLSKIEQMLKEQRTKQSKVCVIS